MNSDTGERRQQYGSVDGQRDKTDSPSEAPADLGDVLLDELALFDAAAGFSQDASPAAFASNYRIYCGSRKSIDSAFWQSAKLQSVEGMSWRRFIATNIDH